MNIKRIVFRMLVFVFVLVMPTLIVFAAPLHQTDGPPELTVTAILLWIATGPGVAWVVGVFVSQVLENIAAWHSLSATIKFLLTLLLSFGLPIAANLLLAWPGLSAIEPWINMGITGVVLWIASQAEYRRLKSASPQYGIRRS